MRIALVFLVLLGGVWLSGAPAAAAPVPVPLLEILLSLRWTAVLSRRVTPFVSRQ